MLLLQRILLSLQQLSKLDLLLLKWLNFVYVWSSFPTLVATNTTTAYETPLSHLERLSCLISDVFQEFERGKGGRFI